MATSRAHQRVFHGRELLPTKEIVVLGLRELRQVAAECRDKRLVAECDACIAALTGVRDDVVLHHDDAQVRDTVDALCCLDRLTFISHASLRYARARLPPQQGSGEECRHQ